MRTRGYALALGVVLLGSLFLARKWGFPGARGSFTVVLPPAIATSTLRASVADAGIPEVRRAPLRDWEVLDPPLRAQAVLIQSLDEYFPFFHYQTNTLWPAASLTKMLTAVVTLQSLEADAKITVSEAAVATEGAAGGLRSGEIYVASDLLKIMLLTSSNDAAAAFEEVLGGRDETARRMNAKAREIGMTRSIFYDAAGLSDLNQVTAADYLRLTRYVIEKHPVLLNWTRSSSFVVQAINDTKIRTIENINPFVSDTSFLGGKTGTSPEAGENLVALFSFHSYRVAVILLGSSGRVAETERLLRWAEEAYHL